MLNQKEEEKLKLICSEKIKANGYDEQEFDVEAEIDRTLSFAENQAILDEKLKHIFPNIEVNMGKWGKKIDTANRDMVNFFEKRNIEEKEKEAEISFMKSLEAIEQDKQSEIIEKIYYIPKSFAKMIARGNSTGLIMTGECGLGKTYTILRAFKEENVEFVFSCGFSSVLQFYQFLYYHRDKNIIFDDVGNLLKSSAILDLLKASLYSPKGTRIVQYNTTSSKLLVPKMFEFTGTITILLNKIGNNEDIKAVADRVLFYNFDLDYQTRIKVIYELSKQPYKSLTEAERKNIAKWIKDNTTNATRNLNLRLLYKLYDVYLFDKVNWETIAKEVIENDKVMLEVKKLINKHNTIKSACEEFVNEGMGSRATFFRVKRKLE